MDTQAKLDLQIAILLRAYWLNRSEPTPGHATYLELCQVALTAAYNANQKGN